MVSMSREKLFHAAKKILAVDYHVINHYLVGVTNVLKHVMLVIVKHLLKFANKVVPRIELLVVINVMQYVMMGIVQYIYHAKKWLK